MREIKGYVVRGTDKRGNIVTGDGITTTEAAVRATRTLTWGGCTDVAIFAVLADGREERLPSYEEALGEIERLTHDLEDEGRRFQEARTDADVAAGLLAEAQAEIERLRAIEALNVGAIDASLVRLGAVTGAIGPMPADPLAALEAAELRLLEAGGWVLAEPDVYGNERWSHPTWKDGQRSEGRQVALTIERRRLAAKGGA